MLSRSEPSSESMGTFAVHGARRMSIHGRMVGKFPPHLGCKETEGSHKMEGARTSVEPISPVFLCGLMQGKREMHSV